MHNTDTNAQCSVLAAPQDLQPKGHGLYLMWDHYAIFYLSAVR